MKLNNSLIIDLFAITIITIISITGLSILTYSRSFAVQEANQSGKDLFVLSPSDLQEFRASSNDIMNQSQNLTKSYQDEIGKWRAGLYDNSTLISITDSFLPRFENLVNSAQNITYPKDYKYIHDALVNSLKSETESYKHFRNYLLSGNKTEDAISTDLLSLALQYEQTYSKFLSMSLVNSSQTVSYPMSPSNENSIHAFLKKGINHESMNLQMSA